MHVKDEIKVAGVLTGRYGVDGEDMAFLKQTETRHKKLIEYGRKVLYSEVILSRFISPAQAFLSQTPSLKLK